MTVAGNLAFQSGALYLVQVNPSNASSANVTAAAPPRSPAPCRRRSPRAATSRAPTPSSRPRAGSRHHVRRLDHDQPPGRLHREPELHRDRRDPEPHRHSGGQRARHRRPEHQPAQRRQLAQHLLQQRRHAAARLRDRLRPDRRQSRQCAEPALRRGRHRRPAGRVPDDQPVPRADARSLRRRPQRDGRRCGPALGFAPERERCRTTSRSPMPRCSRRRRRRRRASSSAGACGAAPMAAATARQAIRRCWAATISPPAPRDLPAASTIVSRPTRWWA